MSTPTPSTIILFDRAMPRALTAALQAERGDLWSAQFCANLPTPQSHAAYLDLWRAIRAAPGRARNARLLLAQPTPRNPQSAESAAAAMDLKTHGWQIKWMAAGAMAHMKLWLFGEELAIIGSHNLTQSAMLANHEASVLTREPTAIGDTAAWLTLAWSRATDRPTFGLS
jgi:phosphatidylserine/phosphatidylglycerophosphate/cardiolipin synthase-like enzyme